MSETLGLKNVNMLSKEQYDGVETPDNSELWAVEVETYSDDNGNWYRVYPDGWCEQGGKLSALGTVTFLKAFRDTNYTILGIKNRAAAGSNPLSVSTYSTTNATFASSSDNSPLWWFACGYIS